MSIPLYWPGQKDAAPGGDFEERAFASNAFSTQLTTAAEYYPPFIWLQLSARHRTWWHCIMQPILQNIESYDPNGWSNRNFDI